MIDKIFTIILLVLAALAVIIFFLWWMATGWKWLPTRKWVGTRSWLTSLVIDWIARRRGRPTFDEMYEDISNSKVIADIRKQYADDEWWEFLKKHRDFKSIVERMDGSLSTNDAVNRKIAKEFIAWFEEHKGL